ncbi:elongation factor P hydroxylase [Ferrimonas sediminicola]|uniref:Elongation factor P hydroxylase n=1 Tax=Ferrimonas sediminicola TaxID=2569538 RepID=A0A4U1BGK0_9GAMM|nr:elongation factor P hydroxylase [Ferrimonas sediminicola]TKB49842.1 elongation factor P hydroxylase [Ferrimonas sediminicola]
MGWSTEVTETPNLALIRLFNLGLGRQFNTRLIDLGSDPLYLPADEHCPWHRIYFAHGFFASALHELAHWTLAGAARRQRVDYGYWYHPDGRSEAQQAAFERVEVKPQAIEWAFHLAAGRRFNVSVDNLGGAQVDRATFQRQVQAQTRRYLKQGFPPRAQALIEDLHRYYATPALSPEQFEC